MSTIYKIKSSATRAAKAQFGEDWKNSCTIIPVEGGFAIQTEKVVEVAPQQLEVALATAEVLVAHDEDTAKKDAKKKEMMANKPTHTPKLPPSIIVAEESAPIPTPILPPALQIAPPADIDVAAQQAEADRQANIALVNKDPFAAKVCPCCGSEEMYTGRVDEKNNSIVVDEEYIVGCHHCDWEVDTRKTAGAGSLRPRISTTDRPTKKVWDVADKMPGAKRKEVIEACVAAGIAYGTARTQYQHWFKCKADSAATPIATIGKDGKIVPPTK